MIAAIEKFFKTIVRVVLQSRIVKRLNNYAVPPKKEIEPMMPEAEPNEVAEPEPAKPSIAFDGAVVLVQCISCGVVHKLSAVCLTCHEPVCTDGFCRENIFDEELDAHVVQCRNCALTQ